MIIEGSVDLSDTRQEATDDATEGETESSKIDMVVIITGCLVLFVGLALMAIYIKYVLSYFL